jgi:hypothetical protein
MIGELRNALSDRLGNLLVAIVLFGSRTLDSSEQQRKDLDIALLIKGRPCPDVLLQIRGVYENLYNTPFTSLAPVCHGPIVVFAEESSILNPILFRIIFEYGQLDILDSQEFAHFVSRMAEANETTSLHDYCDAILREHLHEMRMCMFEHPGYCSNTQESHNFKYHLFVVMKTMVFLKTGKLPVGGEATWQAWEREFGHLLEDRPAESFATLQNLLTDRRTRAMAHTVLCNEVGHGGYLRDIR